MRTDLKDETTEAAGRRLGPARGRRPRRMAAAVTAVALAVAGLGLSSPAVAGEQDTTRQDAEGSARATAGTMSYVRTDRYPGPYADLAGARAITTGDLAAWAERSPYGGSNALESLFDPGVDPPYDPTEELEDLKAPWVPPGNGPDTLTTPGTTPPGGPDTIEYRPTPWDKVTPVHDGCIGGKLVYKSLQSAEDYNPLGDKFFLPAFGWSAVVVLHGSVPNDDSPIPDIYLEERRVDLDSFGEWEYCPELEERQLGLSYWVGYESGTSEEDLVEVVNPGTARRWFFAHPDSEGSVPWYDDPATLLPTAWVDSNVTGDPAQPYGLGDILTNAMNLLTTLAYHGIDPERTDAPFADPHEIYYPSTDCGGGPSCYDPEQRRIYLRSEQGHNDGQTPVSTPFTIHHELGHSLEQDHWGGLVMGGGIHAVDGCSSHQSAYTEGFADFLAAWLTFRRNTDPGSLHGFHIEGPNQYKKVCIPDGSVEKPSAEVWVAATFWDLHDHHADGLDSTGAKGFGAVAALYLAHPPSTAEGAPPPVNQFEQVYKSKLTDQKWATWVDDIVEQNHLH